MGRRLCLLSIFCGYHERGVKDCSECIGCDTPRWIQSPIVVSSVSACLMLLRECYVGEQKQSGQREQDDAVFEY